MTSPESLEKNITEQSPRFALTRILVELGKKNLQTVLPLLEQAINSYDKTLRWTALHELIEIGKTHPEPIVELLETAMGEEPTPNNKKSRVLVSLGKKSLDQIIPVFREALKSKNPDLQWMSILELTALAKDQPEKVIPLFEEALESKNPHLRWMVTLELLELAKHHPKQVAPILTKTLNTASPIKSFYTKDHAFENTAAIEAALRNSDLNLQWIATLEVAELAKHHPADAMPLFEIALQSEHTNIHWLVMVELVKLVKIHPHIITPFLAKLMKEEDTLGKTLNEKRILVEMGQAHISKTLPLLNEALEQEDSGIQSTAILELFELLQHHVEKLGALLTTENKKRNSTVENEFNSQHQQVQQITNLVDKLMEHCHPDLQWTTLYKLLKLKLFTPEKIITMMDKALRKRIHHHQPNIEITRVLVELGQKFPKLAAPAFKQALETNNPEMHWAAMLELQALIKMSPHLAGDFKDIPL